MFDSILEPARSASKASYRDPDLQAFSEFIAFFRAEFARPGFLDGVACRETIREYVPKYYGKTFGAGVEHMDARHFKWFVRMRPLLSLPKGSTIVDYGGGYGLDSVFLASRGYKMVFFEITLSHIAVAEHFAARWRAERGPVELRSILKARGGLEPFGKVDAVMFDEVAHHIEPVHGAFARAASILRPGGRVFLLEPNAWSPVAQAYFLKVRGFKTVIWMTDEKTGERFLYGNEHIRFPFMWDRILDRCGFDLERREHVVPFGLTSEASLSSSVRTSFERIPLVRAVASTHVTSVYRLRAPHAERAERVEALSASPST